MNENLIVVTLSLAMIVAVAPFGATGSAEERAREDPVIQDTLEVTLPEEAAGEIVTVASVEGSLEADLGTPSSSHEDLRGAVERCYFDVVVYRNACESGVDHVMRGEQIYLVTYQHGIAIELVDGLEGDFQSVYTERGNTADLYFETLTCTAEDTGDGFELDCSVHGWGPFATYEAEHYGFAFAKGEADPHVTGEDAADLSYHGSEGWDADGLAGVWLQRV